jgi:hypothetical protein
MGLSRSVMGLLYLYLYHFLCIYVSSIWNIDPTETAALNLFLNVNSFPISFKDPSKYEFSYEKVLISSSERLVRASNQL